MDVKTLKDLSKLAEICRKRGIAEIKVSANSLEFKLWDHIPAATSKSRKKAQIETDSVSVEGGFSDEDILNWSTGLSEGN